MKLTDLQPEFLKVVDAGGRLYVDTLAEAQGVLFKCPKCWAANGGPVGTHSVMCWFAGRNVPTDATPAPRWVLGDKSTGFGDLTVSPSILLVGGCQWHGFITNGEVA